MLPSLYSGTLVVLGPLRLDEVGAGSLAIGGVFLVVAAFALTNLAWAGGQVLGAGAGGWIAERAGDEVPYGALAMLCSLTLVFLALPKHPRSPAEA